MNILRSLILAISALITLIVPSLSSYSVNHGNTHLSNVYPNHLQNENIYVGFSSNNQIAYIYDKETRSVLMNSNSLGAIVIDDLSQQTVLNTTPNSIKFTNGTQITLQNNTLIINSETAKQIQLITNKDWFNNSFSISRLNNQNLQFADVRDKDNFVDSGTQNTKVFVPQHVICSKDDYINRETPSTVYSIRLNNECGHVTKTYANGKQNIRVLSSAPLNNASIVIIPNETNKLIEYNLNHVRNYGIQKFCAVPLLNFLNYFIKTMGGVGLIVYILIIFSLISPFIVYGIFIERQKRNMHRELNAINENFELSDEARKSEIQAIEAKYTPNPMIQFIVSAVPSFITSCIAIYSIPYCYELRNIKFLWTILGQIDKYNLVSQLPLRIVISPLTMLGIIASIYRLLNEQNDRLPIIMQSIMLILATIYLPVASILALAMIYLLTEILSRIVKYYINSSRNI